MRARTFSFLLVIAALFLGSQNLFAQNSNDYKLSILSDLKMEIMDQKQHIVGDTVLIYSNNRSGDKLDLILREVVVAVKLDGNTLIDMTMNAKELDNRADGSKIKLEEANEETKTMLTDSFTTPLAAIVLDEHGKETSRKIIAKPGAVAMVENGQVENARMFHAPFYADKKTWKSPVKMSLGNGNFASGPLTYKVKSTDSKTGNVTVEVSGKLNAKGKQGPLDIVNAVYDVKGSQVFNPKKKDWDSAKYDIAIVFDLAQNGKTIANAKGTMKVGLKPAKIK